MTVVYLSGGVGGARLLEGVVQTLPPGRVTAIVNVGDDFDHLGLRICPDLDTVLYTLAGLADRERGWGRAGETFHALEAIRRYGGDDWFALGDADLGAHLTRTAWLAAGATLTEVTSRLAAALGIPARILPMSDDTLRTRIETEHEGVLDFQDWLVRRRAEPAVRRVRLEGDPRPSAEVLAALEDAEVVLIGPSNPYVSIDPILSLPGVRERVAAKRVVAVSPIVGGRAVKGPLAEMIPRLAGRAPSAAAVAAHYGELLDAFVIEHGDEAELPPDLAVHASATVMRSLEDRLRLAREVLRVAGIEPA